MLQRFSKLSALLAASATAGAGSMNLSPCFVFLVLVLRVQCVFKVFARQYKYKHICIVFKNISKLIKVLLKKELLYRVSAHCEAK